MASVKAITIIDCTDAQNFSVAGVKTFPDTPQGNKEAEATYKEWIESSLESGWKLSRKDFQDALDNGKYEVGEGFIAIIRSL